MRKPDLPSNAGNRAAAANWGRLLLGYFLLATQKKVTSCRATPDGFDFDVGLRANPTFSYPHPHPNPEGTTSHSTKPPAGKSLVIPLKGREQNHTLPHQSLANCPATLPLRDPRDNAHCSASLRTSSVMPPCQP